MKDYNFVKTLDGSVGLYSNTVNDIFHSKSGAMKEAFDKFIIPSFFEKLISNNKRVNILDICYGIGYNTKAALSLINDEYHLSIDCLEFSNELIQLSPFIYDSLNRIDINIFLFSKINYADYDFNFIIKNSEYTDRNMLDFISFIKKEGYVYNPSVVENEFLHNIYYNYITNSTKYVSKINKFNNVSLTYRTGDARISIKDCTKSYDIVFLDAFSPQKDPTLWTIDFLSLIKEKMNDNSVLVSYSKSTPFRSALSKLGFCVGKTFIDGVDMGTVASQSKDKIINPLSDYDIELLNTRSGITYKDSMLNLNSSEILKNREIEQKDSSLISHTQFLKKYLK